MQFSLHLCVGFNAHARHARQDPAILDYVICSTWPRPFRPLPRVRGPRMAKPSFRCQLRSTQLCTIQGQRLEGLFFAKVYRSGAQLHFQISQQRGTSVQRTTMACFLIIEEEQQAAQTSDSREMATSSTDRTAQTPPIILFT